MQWSISGTYLDALRDLLAQPPAFYKISEQKEGDEQLLFLAMLSDAMSSTAAAAVTCNESNNYWSRDALMRNFLEYAQKFIFADTSKENFYRLRINDLKEDKKYWNAALDSGVNDKIDGDVGELIEVADKKIKNLILEGYSDKRLTIRDIFDSNGYLGIYSTLYRAMSGFSHARWSVMVAGNMKLKKWDADESSVGFLLQFLSGSYLKLIERVGGSKLFYLPYYKKAVGE